MSPVSNMFYANNHYFSFKIGTSTLLVYFTCFAFLEDGESEMVNISARWGKMMSVYVYENCTASGVVGVNVLVDAVDVVVLIIHISSTDDDDPDAR